MKRTLVFILAALLFQSIAFADETLRNGLTISKEQAHGADRQYPFEQVTLTPAPQGYEAFHIEHYGRHGSRYAYSLSYYTFPHKAFENARKAGVLTPLGRKIADSLAVHYDHYCLRMGDLSNNGWADLQKSAGIMYDNFPSVFEDGQVTACASSSFRSVMSMSAYCLGLKSRKADLPIFEDQGRLSLNETNPRDKNNPGKLRPRNIPQKFNVTLDKFQDSRVDTDAILGKLFTDVSVACKGMDRNDLLRRMFVLVAGMASLNEEDRTDFSGFLTDKEFVSLWEVDNYKRFIEYWPYFYECTPAAATILDSASAAVNAGKKGARLRFGHDHVILPLYFILGIENLHKVAPTIDELSKYFHTFESPMGTNFYMVFYRSKANDDILVKVMVNGREASLPIKSVDGPYYCWKSYEQWCRDHILSICRQF